MLKAGLHTYWNVRSLQMLPIKIPTKTREVPGDPIISPPETITARELIL
jgi:hypothetical protein